MEVKNGNNKNQIVYLRLYGLNGFREVYRVLFLWKLWSIVLSLWY